MKHSTIYQKQGFLYSTFLTLQDEQGRLKIVDGDVEQTQLLSELIQCIQKSMVTPATHQPKSDRQNGN